MGEFHCCPLDGYCCVTPLEEFWGLVRLTVCMGTSLNQVIRCHVLGGTSVRFSSCVCLRMFCVCFQERSVHILCMRLTGLKYMIASCLHAWMYKRSGMKEVYGDCSEEYNARLSPSTPACFIRIRANSLLDRWGFYAVVVKRFLIQHSYIRGWCSSRADHW